MDNTLNIPNSKYCTLRIIGLEKINQNYNIFTDSIKYDFYKLNDVSFVSLKFDVISGKLGEFKTVEFFYNWGRHFNDTKTIYYSAANRLHEEKNFNLNHITSITFEELKISEDGQICYVNMCGFDYTKVFDTIEQAKLVYEKKSKEIEDDKLKEENWKKEQDEKEMEKQKRIEELTKEKPSIWKSIRNFIEGQW